MQLSNGMARSIFIGDTDSHDFSTRAYKVKFLRDTKIQSIADAWSVNSSDVSSATTMAAGSEYGGRVTSLKLITGGAVQAYVAPAEWFNNPYNNTTQ